jgi:hypothetical protein
MNSKMNRRIFFLQGSSLAVLSTLLSRSAFAESPGTILSPLAAPNGGGPPWAAPVFNGGRSQVNLSFLQIGGDYPFLNCLKNAQFWSFIDNSGWPEPSSLDSNGYPLTISNRGVYTVFDVPSQAARPGNYVITWSGNGTIFCGMSHIPSSGRKTSTNGSGRYVFSTIETRFVVGISSIGSPRITDLQVFHANDEEALNAGQIFGTKFKQRLAEANFGVIRFLNWQSGNTTNVTTWETRKPLTYVFYAGQEFRPSLYAGLTTNIGAAYFATLPGFTLVDKATVMVKFNASNSSACTLNLSGTGDINILSEYSRALNSSSYPIGGSTSRGFATLVYDATLNSWIKQGGDLSMGGAGLINGCPPELMVRLCAEVGAHPYFVTPPFSIDPATDYMPSLAAYCRANGPSWMIPRFEGPNELWNNASGFFGTGYAVAKATAYGWGPDFHNWYGKAMSVLGQAVSAAYEGDRTKYQVLCGVQTASGSSAASTASSNGRLASTKYIAQSTPPQSPYTRSAASNWVTHICCAQYYGPSEYGTEQETTDADAFAAAATDSTLQNSIAAKYANTSNSGIGPFTIPKVALLYSAWKKWAQGFSINRMCGYEGGYSPDYTNNGTSAVDLLRAASKLAPSLSGFTSTNYNNFVGLSGNDFTSEFPSSFQLSGRAPSNNVWSLLEDIYQTVNPPQWNAIVEFNR